MATVSERLAGPPPSEAPPVTEVGVIGWLKDNLFNSGLSTVLTLISLYIIFILFRMGISFFFGTFTVMPLVLRAIPVLLIIFVGIVAVRALTGGDVSLRGILNSLGVLAGAVAVLALLLRIPQGFERPLFLARLIPRIPEAAIAEWEVITSNLVLFAIGQYPRPQAWRTIAALSIVVGLGLLHALLWRRAAAARRVLVFLWLLSFPAVWIILRGSEGTLLWRFLALLAAIAIIGAILRLLHGLLWPGSALAAGVMIVLWQLSIPAIWFLLRLNNVETLAVLQTVFPSIRSQLWSGLLLTIMLTVVGIVVSFPLGVLLALGRRSDMIIIKLLSTVYIEGVRGVPLISILFMAQVMLPLFIGNSNLDVVIRAMAGVTLFSAAYLAENVRGGLQAIPNGQVEAAQALGLNVPQITGLIVLPQALRIVIPAIVGQFISLFKDTTLVSIITLLDLLGISEAALAQDPAFQNHKTEVFLFLAAIYFVFSYIMSSAARRIEATGSGMGGTRRL